MQIVSVSYITPLLGSDEQCEQYVQDSVTAKNCRCPQQHANTCAEVLWEGWREGVGGCLTLLIARSSGFIPQGRITII